MAMVPIGIESLMIALLILITGKYKAGSTTPPGAKLRAFRCPLTFVWGTRRRFKPACHRRKNLRRPRAVRRYLVWCADTASGAGAAEVQLSEGQTTAINRVASGEVLRFWLWCPWKRPSYFPKSRAWDFSSAALAARIEGTTEHTMRAGTAFPKTKSGAPVARRT